MQERQLIDLKVKRVVVNGINMIVAYGECDICSAQLLKDTMAEIIHEGYQELIVNVKNLCYLDNSGLAAILWARHKIEENGGKLVIVGLNGNHRSMSDSLGELFKIAPSVKQALRLFNRRSLSSN